MPDLQSVEETEQVQQESQIGKDLDLARRMAGSCPEALEELIQDHGEYLKNLLGRLSAFSHDVDDLLQETLMRAWSQARSYRGEAPMRHWTTKIAIGVCRNHQRASRRLLKHLQGVWQQRSTETQRDLRQEDVRDEAMQKGMQQLSHSDRELLVLFHIEQQSLESISKLLGAKAETLHVRLHRARERLKAIVKGMGVR